MLLVCLLFFVSVLDAGSLFAAAVPDTVHLSAGSTNLAIRRDGLAFNIEHSGRTIVPARSGDGLLIGDPDHPEAVSAVESSFDSSGHPVFGVRSSSGKTARVTITLTPNQTDIVVRTPEPDAVLLRLAPASPGFGLADHAVVGRKSFDTDITGYSNDQFLSGQGLTRLVSNFVIYPRQGFAFLVWDPGVKIVRSSAEECTQGVRRTETDVRFTIFVGTPREIYRQFLESRDLFGYPVFRPKYEFFGVGWEAFGALAWDTNHKTVTENVEHYLADGYPLRWMVVGSGFWPKAEKRMHETTSFGYYDKTLYPDPAGLIAHFHAKGLKFFQGLRTTFVTDGPFSEEGRTNGYFVQEDGAPKVLKFGWPESPINFLDWRKPEAVAWFTSLVHKWTAYGVDGFKEDVYGFGKYTLGDDKLDPVDSALMREGLYVMGRNGYLTSAADLHRINDFNFNQNQDRGPVNALAIAYAGFPLVYPDIVGGTFGEGHFDLKVTPRMKTYMMRNAQWASLHSSMSMGQGPWTFGDKKLESVLLAAARLHDRLQPYIYSQAQRWYLEGYPWTMAPLPVAFPDDPDVYGRENARVRGYEWMIGDALLAIPLYGNDFETATTRDVYLPPGTWIDYDTGKRYEGPALLKGFELPVGKTPLFVGGSGIIVERKDAGLVVRVYPATSKSQSVFIDPEGKKSTIEIEVSDWSHPTVAAGAGQKVGASWQRHALEFTMRPGENYRIH